MFERAERWRRILATGFCFACFGVGGIMMRVFIFPLVRLLIWKPEDRSWIARRLIHHSFRGFIAMVRACGVFSYEVHGLHKLRRKGLLIVANHPSLADILFLIAFVKNADCIVKADLARNPFTSGPVLTAGFTCNDSGPGLIRDCLTSLRAGGNLIIFPEGTRTARGGNIRLKRGAANVAVRGRIDVTPIRIRVDPPMLWKGVPWWRVPARRGHFVIEVGDDIIVDNFLEGGVSEALAARRLNLYLTKYFASEESSGPTGAGNQGVDYLGAGAGGLAS